MDGFKSVPYVSWHLHQASQLLSVSHVKQR